MAAIPHAAMNLTTDNRPPFEILDVVRPCFVHGHGPNFANSPRWSERSSGGASGLVMTSLVASPPLNPLNHCFHRQRVELRTKMLQDVVACGGGSQLRLDDRNSAGANVPTSFGRGECDDLVPHTPPDSFDAPISNLVGDLRQARSRTPSLLNDLKKSHTESLILPQVKLVTAAWRLHLSGTTHRTGPGRFFIPRQSGRHGMAGQSVGRHPAARTARAGLLTEPVARNPQNSSEPDTLPVPLDPTELIP